MRYGGPEGLKRLVDACHRAGLAVILDVVYNHLGPEGNYLARFGPYFTDRYRTPWGGAVNFDGPGSREVRRFFCDNALMWLRDYHFDGLRLDAVHAIFDHSAVHFLEQLAGEVERLETELGRHLALIAESDLNDPRIVRPREVGGYGIHAQWSDDFHHALHTVLTGERDGYYADFGSLAHLAKAVRHGFVYDGGWSPFRRHLHGRSAAGLSGHQFVACWQNHDQIGNRARGDRATHLVSEARLKIGAALLLTAPFLPLLFQGEEWGAQTYFPYFTQHEDAALGVAVREGRRREFAEFGWNPDDVPDPQARRTFENARLDWGEAHGEILAWYRSLIALRRALPDLSDGRLDRVHATHHGEERFAMERGAVQVVCNLGRRVELPAGRFSALLLASGARLSGGWVEMEPDGAAILGDPRDPSVRDYLVQAKPGLRSAHPGYIVSFRGFPPNDENRGAPGPTCGRARSPKYLLLAFGERGRQHGRGVCRRGRGGLERPDRFRPHRQDQPGGILLVSGPHAVHLHAEYLGAGI